MPERARPQFRSGARSRWRGARAHVVPHWTAPVRPARRRTVLTLKAYWLEPPGSNGGKEA